VDEPESISSHILSHFPKRPPSCEWPSLSEFALLFTLFSTTITATITDISSMEDEIENPSRPLGVTDVLNYLYAIKTQFDAIGEPDIYGQFMDVLKEFGKGRIDRTGVAERVVELFGEYPPLIEGFNTFLQPSGYRIVPASEPSVMQDGASGHANLPQGIDNLSLAPVALVTGEGSGDDKDVDGVRQSEMAVTMPEATMRGRMGENPEGGLICRSDHD
jgi:histone deacetylase complex regulatory component SIN3